MRFENQTFTADITIDGNEFIDCVIENCVVHHYGGPFSLVKSSFRNVRFAFHDASNNALAFLRLIRSMPNGDRLIAELLEAPRQTTRLN
jgi:hypothetical protein